MQEIKCPKCGEIFKIDDSGYFAIVKQIHDKEFSEEIKKWKAEYETNKIKELEAEKDKALAQKEAEKAKELEALRKEKEDQINQLKDDIRVINSNNVITLAEKNNQIGKLQAQLDNEPAKIETAVIKAVSPSRGVSVFVTAVKTVVSP